MLMREKVNLIVPAVPPLAKGMKEHRWWHLPGSLIQGCPLEGSEIIMEFLSFPKDTDVGYFLFHPNYHPNHYISNQLKDIIE